jgi:hypothetical protein
MAATLPLFYGDGREGENGQNWMKRFFMTYVGEEEKKRLELLESAMADGSRAEEWFSNLKDEDKASWAEVRKKWDEKWPKTRVETKKKAEAQKELMALTVTEEEMSEKVEKGGREITKVEEWAEKAKVLATEAGVDESDTLIALVHDKLPLAICDKVSAKQTNWTSFTKAVRDVDKGYLREKAEKAKKD